MNLKALFIAPLLLGSTAFAQTKHTATTAKTAGADVWRKEVSHDVDISIPDDTVHRHFRNQGDDSTMLEMMVVRMKSGKLSAYSNYDTHFSTKLTKDNMIQMLGGKTDTMTAVDPVTGQERMKVVHMDFNYDVVTKYRILEEWIFNPHTGVTDVQITGIAPIKDIYNEDGSLRASATMFWVHYGDVKDIIAAYDSYHPQHTIADAIWRDYFDVPEAKH